MQVNPLSPSTSSGGITARGTTTATGGPSGNAQAMSPGRTSFAHADVEPNPVFESTAPPQVAAASASQAAASLLTLHDPSTSTTTLDGAAINHGTMLPHSYNFQVQQHQQASMQAFGMPLLPATSITANSDIAANSSHLARLEQAQRHQVAPTQHVLGTVQSPTTSLTAATTGTVSLSQVLQSIASNVGGLSGAGVANSPILPQPLDQTGLASTIMGQQAFPTSNTTNGANTSSFLSLSHPNLHNQRGLVGVQSSSTTGTPIQQGLTTAGSILPRPNDTGTVQASSADPSLTATTATTCAHPHHNPNSAFFHQDG